MPDQRLAVTEETEIHSCEGWQTVELTSPIDVNEGDAIWLAWVFESNPGIRYESGTPGRAQSSQTWSGDMPSTFGSCTTDNYIYSIYANYTPDEQDENPDLIGNPYMFTGRRYDLETGLYYYRARYYNPQIGRFLQTDPVGYDDGINWYNYCGNNPLSWVDSFGTHSYTLTGAGVLGGGWHYEIFDDDGNMIDDGDITSIYSFIRLFVGHQMEFDRDWMCTQPEAMLWLRSLGYINYDYQLFWELRLLVEMGVFSSEDMQKMIKQHFFCKFSFVLNA